MRLVVGSKLIVLYFGQRDEALTKKNDPSRRYKNYRILFQNEALENLL